MSTRAVLSKSFSLSPLHLSRSWLCLLALILAAVTAQVSAQTCASRGDLDTPYCDVNRDLVADTPATTIDPSNIVVGISAVEDHATAQRTYGPMLKTLGSCLKKDVVLYHNTTERQVLEGMRGGTIHIGQFATGGTMFAVNFAGAVPFAAKGQLSAKKMDSYTLMLIVKADSNFRKPTDLIGRTVAHTTPTSNSGNLAPRALFPELGLTPDKDYKVEYSKKHDNSINGVRMGVYDAAAIASDVFDRLVAKGEIKRNQFRILFESEEFPSDAFAYAHNLSPALVTQIKKCVLDYKFPDAMAQQLEGNNRFFPVDYNREWRVIRLIAKASGTVMNKETYNKIIAPK